jgi:6-phosphogluconolactonase (cycloisomerase 2 family)
VDFRTLHAMHRIKITATEEVHNAIRALGRTEDAKFSPDNRRLVVVGFLRNTLFIFDVDFDLSTSDKSVSLTGLKEITSSCLKKPHSVFFIDDDTLVVANRDSEVSILALPPRGSTRTKWELNPLQTICSKQAPFLKSPSAVSMLQVDPQRYELLICNNDSDTVSRHILEKNGLLTVSRNEVFLKKNLRVPDGVSVNRDSRWIAISSHNGHCVFLYENTSRLNSNSEPDGILRGVNFPHGLRFTPDDKFILVADAGAPYVNVYSRNGRSWKGSRNPIAAFRVMDEELYRRGCTYPGEGGPKGIDIDRDMNVLVTTGNIQPLLFFDLPAILKLREVPLDARKRSLDRRLEYMQANLRVVRNFLQLRTRLRRLRSPVYVLKSPGKANQ